MLDARGERGHRANVEGEATCCERARSGERADCGDFSRVCDEKAAALYQPGQRLEKDSPHPRKRTPRMSCLTDDDDFSAFAAVLRNGDKTRAKLEREKLKLAKIQYGEHEKISFSKKMSIFHDGKDAHKLELERLNLVLHTVFKK